MAMELSTFNIYQVNQNRMGLPCLVKEKSCKYENLQANNADIVNSILRKAFKPEKQIEEHVYMLAMNNHNEVVGAFVVSHGSFESSITDPGAIIIRALLCNAHRIVIAHNHPSGNPEPSSMDYNTTQRIKNACNICGIELLDHLVIAGKLYVSCMVEN